MVDSIGKYDKVANAVKQKADAIAASEGNKKKIDTKAEYDKLQEMLTSGDVTGKDNVNYVKGLMVEYETEIAKAKQKEREDSVSKDFRKKIDKITKDGVDDIAADKLLSLLKNTKGELSKEELAYIRDILKENGYPVPHETPEVTDKVDKEEPEKKTEVDPEPKDKKTPEEKDYSEKKDVTDKKETPVRRNPKGNNSPSIKYTPTIPEYNMTPPVKKPTKKKETEKAKPKPLTATEKQNAQNFGKTVSKALIGWTTDNDAVTVISIIQNNVNSRNVLEFLRGYESKYKGSGGNHFFEQMLSEYGHDEMIQSSFTVAQRLSQKLAAEGNKDNAKQIQSLVGDGRLTMDEAQELDNLVQALLRQNP